MIDIEAARAVVLDILERSADLEETFTGELAAATRSWRFAGPTAPPPGHPYRADFEAWAPTISILCPSCGRTASRKAAEQGSPVTTCDRCEQAGHLALTLEENMTMTDHREDIFDAARRYTADAREAVSEEGIENGYELAYNIEVFTSNHDRRRVEFLLAGGGPTVYVIVDQYDRVDFLHSWGMDEEGNDRTTVGLSGEDATFWLAQAEEYADLMAPRNV